MGLPNIFDIDVALFVGNQKLPVSSLTITTAFNQLPTAVVSLPPDKELLNLFRGNKVPVQIFIKDTFGGKGDYILLFEGFVISSGYSRNAISKEISISCEHTLNFLKYLTVEFFTGIDEYLNFKINSGLSSKGSYNGLFGFPMTLFYNGFLPSTDGSTLINYPVEFLENLYKFLINEGRKANELSALDLYYAEFVKYIKFNKRIARVPYFDDNQIFQTNNTIGFPLLRGLQQTAVVDVMQQLISTNTYDTLYNFIDNIVSQLEYEFFVPNNPKGNANEMKGLALKPIFYEAAPPLCNLITPSTIIGGVDYSEIIYNIPTRIVSKDVHNILTRQVVDNPLKNAATTYIYPDKTDEVESTSDPLLLKVLDMEKYMGPVPYFYRLPMWLQFVSSAYNNSSEINELKKYILRHVLLLKHYEARQLRVTTSFNPYITAGFPALVVEDFKDLGNSFVGHVVSVSHNISKGDISTNVEMRFVRTLEEELSSPLLPTIPQLAAITKKEETVYDIYNELLGCAALPFYEVNYTDVYNDLKDLMDVSTTPKGQYIINSRNIITLTDYFKFMNISFE